MRVMKIEEEDLLQVRFVFAFHSIYQSRVHAMLSSPLDTSLCRHPSLFGLDRPIHLPITPPLPHHRLFPPLSPKHKGRNPPFCSNPNPPQTTNPKTE
jgi:hypothetical protein